MSFGVMTCFHSGEGRGIGGCGRRWGRGEGVSGGREGVEMSGGVREGEERGGGVMRVEEWRGGGKERRGRE